MNKVLLTRIAVLVELILRTSPVAAVTLEELTLGARFPLCDCDVTVPTIQSQRHALDLMQPTLVPVVYLIVPSEKDPAFAAEMQMVQRESVVWGNGARLRLVDQSAQSDDQRKVVQWLLTNTTHRASTTEPVWVFFKPPSSMNGADDKAFTWYDEQDTHTPLPLTQAGLDAQLEAFGAVRHPLTATDIMTAEEWIRLTNMEGIPPQANDPA